MLSDAELRQIGAYSEKLLSCDSFNDAADKESLLKDEIALCNEFKKAIKNGDFAIYEVESVKKALEKCREDIGAYISQFQRMIRKSQETIRQYDNQESIINSHNQEVRYQRYDREQELAKLGFFDGKRKKELEQELSKWQYQDVPDYIEEKRQELNKKIKWCEAQIEPYQDKIKGINFYMDEAERHFATIQGAKKPQRSYARQTEAEQRERKSVREALREKQEQIKTQQKPQEAQKEALNIKGLKEVHKPNLKPLKRL